MQRRNRYFVFCLLSPLMVTHAKAEGPEARPPTWDMNQEELEAVGLGQWRGAPIPVPAAGPEAGAPTPGVGAGEPTVIFVNFDGVVLQRQFPDDALNNISVIHGGEFAPYGDNPSRRAATMAAVRADWAPYNVVIVDSRPASGPYTMSVTSPTNPEGFGVLGVAPVDCDNRSPNNVTFAFHGADDQFGAATQATTIGQEVAHSFGLEHVNDPSDIMNPRNAGGDPSFRDECIEILQGGNCQSQHQQHCGSGFMQNSHQELLALLGPAMADVESPVVEIVYPQDGDEFAAGSDFEILAEASDNTAVTSVELFNDGVSQNADTTEPYSWSVSQIPAGVYRLSVTATDAAGNEATSDVVTITVNSGASAPGSDSGGGSAGSESGGASESEGLPPDDGQAGDGGAGDSEGGTYSGQIPSAGAEGCGCRQSNGAKPMGWAWLPLLLCLPLRRQSRSVARR